MRDNIANLLSSIFAFLFGNFDFILKALLTLMLIDYITGVSRAFVSKKVNSSIGAKGIIKKVMYLCVVTVTVLLDGLLELNGSLRTLIIYTFIFNEIISILENSSSLGIKIPNYLKNALEKLNQEQLK